MDGGQGRIIAGYMWKPKYIFGLLDLGKISTKH